MNIAASPPRRRGLLLLALAVLLAAAAALAIAASGGTPAARAGLNDNQTRCHGSLKNGGKDPDDPTVSILAYRFACSNPITGFQVQPDKAAVEYETELFPADLQGNPVEGDAFGCFGDLPGYGINCTGNYSGNWEVTSGTFKIEGDACAEPRVDALLTVVRATISGGKAAQAMAGPFDMGRPLGCPKSKLAGRTRIPTDKGDTVLG